MVGLFHGKSQSKMDDLGVPPFHETSISHDGSMYGMLTFGVY